MSNAEHKDDLECSICENGQDDCDYCSPFGNNPIKYWPGFDKPICEDCYYKNHRAEEKSSAPKDSYVEIAHQEIRALAEKYGKEKAFALLEYMKNF